MDRWRDCFTLFFCIASHFFQSGTTFHCQQKKTKKTPSIMIPLAENQNFSSSFELKTVYIIQDVLTQVFTVCIDN